LHIYYEEVVYDEEVAHSSTSFDEVAKVVSVANIRSESIVSVLSETPRIDKRTNRPLPSQLKKSDSK